MTLVKICGLKTEQIVQECIEAGADFLGFVFVKRSPRFVTLEIARPLISQARSAGVGTVGLWQSNGSLPLDQVIDSGIDILQVYGTPTQDIHLPVWYAMGVSRKEDLPSAALQCDRLVLDASPPKGSVIEGGHGTVFDWRILRKWSPPQSWILAGGLNPNNVADAIQISGANAVDVSSGVELTKGQKDPILIRDFIRRAKAVTADK